MKIMSNLEGKFIVIEGPDGAGSSTQVRKLGSYFARRNIPALETKEPTNGLVGGIIRAALNKIWACSPYGLQLLFCADRALHLYHEVEPALKAGKWVISDRYAPSTIVYGATENPEIDEDIWNRLKLINDPFRKPDLSLFLDIEIRLGIGRMDSDGTRAMRDLYETEERLARVMSGYRRLAREYLHAVLVDANGSIEDVHKRIVGVVNERLLGGQNE